MATGGGWRVEKRYQPKVLLGNWVEERQQFTKDRYDHNTTYRTDFTKFPALQPDTIVRRKALQHNQGLNKKFLFSHHGDAYKNYTITWYDEEINKRKREPWDQLPQFRSWDSSTLSWRPERSDHPMRGPPTNFGLYEKLVGKARNAPENCGPDYLTTYTSSYTPIAPQIYKLSRYAQHRLYPHEEPKTVTASSAQTAGAHQSAAAVTGPSTVPEPAPVTTALTPVAC